MPMTLLFLTGTLSSNALSRVHCLYLVALEAGYEVHSVVTTEPGEIWGPFANSDFATLCRRVDGDELKRLMRTCDAVVAFKPFAETLGAAHRAERAGESGPIIVDIDDPDLEVRISWKHTRARVLVNAICRPRVVAASLSLRRIARGYMCLTSNPILQRIYGGEVVPQATIDSGPGLPHLSDRPLVSFIGTNRPHKGLPILREAVAALESRGFRLLVTDNAPPDAKPWEQWVGSVDSDTAQRLVAEADIVVIASQSWGMALGQLPIKLIRAMLAGRAIAVSRVGPLPWAVGDGGLVVEPESLPALVAALKELQSPTRRAELGARSREIALSRFTPSAIAPAFTRALLAATTQRASVKSGASAPMDGAR